MSTVRRSVSFLLDSFLRCDLNFIFLFRSGNSSFETVALVVVAAAKAAFRLATLFPDGCGNDLFRETGCELKREDG